MNELSGSIPTELSNLTKLEHLKLFFNDLTGNIPTEFENLINLKQLVLYYNNLTGNIPSGIGDLNKLSVLQLSGNQLSGGIPGEFGNLNNLVVFSIENNDLSGCYPSNLDILCTQLQPSFFRGNEHVSDGNNFDATWQTFCNTGAGTCTVDIDNTHQNIFTVYPIPAKDVVIFDVPNIAAADEIILYDITGKQISRQAFPQDKRLAVSHLNDGVYIYRIFYENEVYSGNWTLDILEIR